MTSERVLNFCRQLELLTLFLEDNLMENYVAITQIVMVLFQPLKTDYSVCVTSMYAHFPSVFS